MTYAEVKVKAQKYWAAAKREETVIFAAFLGSVETLHANFGELTENLPHWHWLSRLEHWIFAMLGFLVVYTRLKRILADAEKG